MPPTLSNPSDGARRLFNHDYKSRSHTATLAVSYLGQGWTRGCDTHALDVPAQDSMCAGAQLRSRNEHDLSAGM